MLLDPHEHNIALHLAEAGERARVGSPATPDGGFAGVLRDRLISDVPLPAGEPPGRWSLPSFVRLPRVRLPRVRLPRPLPLAATALLLFAGAVAAAELYVAMGNRSSDSPGSSLVAVVPPDSVAESSARPSLEPSPAESAPPTTDATSQPAPGATAVATTKPTPKPTPKPSGQPTQVPTPRPSGQPTPAPTAVPTPVPTPAPTAPSAPVLLTAVGGLPGEIALTWLPPSDDGGAPITGYNVCQSDQPGGPYSCSATGSTLPLTTVSGLTPGNQYWFRVQAVNSIGTGPMSNEDSAVAGT